MRDFSKVSPTVWRSKKFRSLPDMEAKHVYLYLLTCPHGNSAGCFDLHPMYACADLGMIEIRYRQCISMLSAAGLIEWDDDENTVLITNWDEFNAPANARHAAGIISQLSQASSLSLKVKAFQPLRQDIATRKFDKEAFVRNAIATFVEQYSDGIPTETRDRDQTKTETRPDLDETETREESSRQPRPVAALKGDGPTASVSRLMETRLMRNTA